ncbi:MAG: type I methionyl aminopeptidase [Erysipelotrichaceae bacterium]|nr:type I methionyl aminopeptidase [Erysipelotrichaceae bacterium]
MITLRSPREIELMDHAGTIIALVHKRMKEIIVPGISTYEIDKEAEKVIRENGAIPTEKGYQGFPCASCTSVNDMLVHGIPDRKTILKDGDIITVDVVATYKGYMADSGWSYTVGNVKPEVIEFMKVTEEALYKGIEQAVPGNHIGDISNAIQTYVEAHGYSLPIEYTGHGIGTHMHEDPYVPNVGKPGTGPLLKKGMCIAIEPMTFMGKPHCYTLSDGWGVKSRDHSLAAHYEHTVAILEDGAKILTKED